MKALQLQAVGQLKLVEVATPTIQDDELLIRTQAATICTSDLNDIRENPFDIQLPVTMGHEGAGLVAAVGGRVEGFKVGDRVAAHPVHPCGQCVNCRGGRRHLCTRREHFGLNRPGAFAEYFPVRADRARRIADSVSFATAALAEPVCVCLEALAQARLPRNGKLLIMGDGPFGILIARLAQRMPLDHVVIVGRHDFRLSSAGCATQINTNDYDDVASRLRAEAGEAGYDAAILAVGSAQAVSQSLALLRAKGRLVIFSAIPGATPLDLFDIHLCELEVIGACNDEDRMDEAIALLADQKLGLEQLITHTFPIEEYEEAFALAAHRHEQALKVAFAFLSKTGHRDD